MPGPGPGSCLRRGGGGGGRAGRRLGSLTHAPRSSSLLALSPSRLLLLLHLLLLTARGGGRQGAGAPGPARTPRPRPERLAPRRHWLGCRDEGAEPRRGDTGPGREAGGRNAATYGAGPPRRAPLPRFPLLQPDPGHLRATGARRPKGRGLAGLRAGPPAGASRGGGAASLLGGVARGAGERGVTAPQKCRPCSSLASQRGPKIHPPRVRRPGTLLGHRPSPWVKKEGGISILFSSWGRCPSDSLRLVCKPRSSPLHLEGLFLASSPSLCQEGCVHLSKSLFPSLYPFLL